MRALTIIFLIAVTTILGKPAVRADEPACTPETAVAVGFRDLLHNSDHYLDKCVRVHGILAFRALHPDLLSLYTPFDFSHINEIAVYASEEDEDRLWTARSEVELTGIATTCEAIDSEAEAEQQKASAPPGAETIVMVIGQCHYHGGAALQVSFTNWLSAGKVRLAGEANRSWYGDLTRVMSSSWRIQTVRPVVEAWFNAVRQRDLATMFKPKSDWSENLRNELLDAKTSPLRTFFGSRKPFEIAYFQTKDWLRGEPKWRETFACVCKIDACDGEWPISETDVWSNPAWPYYCVRSTESTPITAL